MWTNFKAGDWFGEQSAINDETHPWTIEVCSKKATVLKIHRSLFFKHFGGTDGAPVDALRSVIKMKYNWNLMKYNKINSMTS